MKTYLVIEPNKAYVILKENAEEARHWAIDFANHSGDDVYVRPIESLQFIGNSREHLTIINDKLKVTTEDQFKVVATLEHDNGTSDVTFSVYLMNPTSNFFLITQAVQQAIAQILKMENAPERAIVKLSIERI